MLNKTVLFVAVSVLMLVLAGGLVPASAFPSQEPLRQASDMVRCLDGYGGAPPIRALNCYRTACKVHHCSPAAVEVYRRYMSQFPGEATELENYSYPADARGSVRSRR
jgi:hypothetical protein